MAALTANVTIQTRARAGRDAYIVDGSTTIYSGGLVGVNTAGHLVAWADTSGHEFLGVALGNIAGGETAEDIPIDTSGCIIESASVASGVQASVGELIYGTSSNVDDMALTASNTGPIGIGIRFISAGVMDVQLFTPTEHHDLP